MFANLQVTKKLSEAKFPVYLVTYIPNGHQYAMKIFPWEDDAPSTFFINEKRFAKFHHPNIVSIVYYEQEHEMVASNLTMKTSFLLMEFAKYGDFFDVLISYKVPFDEIVVRTYFHQLIEAIEVMHSYGAAHLDLKLENLLLTEEFVLKLVDFDLSHMIEDGEVKTRGTKNFRAPEMLKGTCQNPQAADIYSAGVILFLMKTSGLVPFQENDSDEGNFGETNLYRFWETQCEALEEKPSFFSEDFKSLFARMTKVVPSERATISQIKSSKWYKKEIYSQGELREYMRRNSKLFR